ncbi:MAG: polysaccharide deacetylase family protein [Candidatus Fimimorpha sp.]
MAGIALCGLLIISLLSGCTAGNQEVETMLEGLNTSLQALASADQQEAVEASVQASQQVSQAVEAALIQVSQEASAQAAEEASVQASQAAEAESIQASQAAEAASIQASQAEAESIQASQAAEAESIQASQAVEAASIQASQAAEAESIQASQAAAQSAQSVLQPPPGHQGPWVGGRTVYLTFDDGPSYLTPQVLDILDRYQIKATFFVTYTERPEIVPYYNEIVRRGHAIGIHTASHEYAQIYSSMEAFVADFDKIYNYVQALTGVSCQLYRFPGGSTTSWNTGIREQIKAWFVQRGIIYHDWNVVTGDGGTVTAEEAYRNVVDNIVPRTHPVILLHDGVKKETTVEALPRIIETLKSWGFTFAALDPSVEPIRQGINW